ncbi:MAG: metal ABC transporter substrate-binding protein [Nitrosopumilus sp.]|nr:metal ABC transporter substrate-binding protein [Nitrosopumilus sp.]MDH3824231.1 metal ABC transporter substrate-binding protein [Nitrosopumilus sp.]
MNNQVKLSIIAIIVLIPLASFSVWATDSGLQTNQKDNSKKINAIASFYPLYDFAKQVGQDKVDVQLLVPTGVEPHDWEPTIQDVQQMQKSNLIIINGIGFENWVHSLKELNYSGTIVDTSVGIIIRDSEIIDEHETDEHDHESGDPHIWLNPVLAKIQVQNIADSFSQQDPQNQQFYQTNAKSYIKKLDNLDNKIRKELSTCNRDFIAFHDAFSYFADEYELHQHTIISSNDPHAEPTAKTLENVINTARELQIQIIFTEESVDTRVSNVIANEISGKILVLSPIETGIDGNYISRMTQNLDNLKEALC